MAFAGNKREPVILLAETSGNCMATSCPLSDNVSKAENILKTKDRTRRFSFAKAENILKESQLLKTMGKWNLGDNLSGDAEHVVPKARSCLSLCLV
jgi:hypothetical protein